MKAHMLFIPMMAGWRLYYSSVIVKKNHDFLIYPLDNLSSGLYLCTLYSGGKAVANAKLIVKK